MKKLLSSLKQWVDKIFKKEKHKASELKTKALFKKAFMPEEEYMDRRGIWNAERVLENLPSFQEEIEEGIPVEDAFRMWKDEQRKQEAKEKPHTYGDALKLYLDSTNLLKKQ